MLILIDGDATVFANELIRKGEKGGPEAADLLFTMATEYADECLPHLNSPKLVVKIFANLRQLGSSLLQAGVVDKVSIFDDFVRGFNSSQLSFEFVDSGIPKDRTRDKIGGE